MLEEFSYELGCSAACAWRHISGMDTFSCVDILCSRMTTVWNMKIHEDEVENICGVRGDKQCYLTATKFSFHLPLIYY